MPRRKRVRRKNMQLLLSEEQVVLSKERTILAFMSTAVAFIGIGIVIVNVLNDGFSRAVGYGLIVIGVIEIGECIRRLIEKKKVMDRLSKQTGV